MNVTREQILRLAVINSEKLDSGSPVKCEFTVSGGVIGSAKNATWHLSDRTSSVLAEHASVDFTDGYFCLTDLHGQVFVNNATTAVGYQQRVKLLNGDELHLGVFRIQVTVGSLKADPSLEYLVGQQGSEDFADLISKAGASGSDTVYDPLAALQHSYSDPSVPFSDNSVSPPEQAFIDLPEFHDPQQQADFHNSHDALRALSQGLGQSLTVSEAGAQMMLQELGKVVRATVEGLLFLQSEQAALADRQLHIIEDNPLRLGLNYQETLSLLFSEGKSPVHLSASAAINEMFDNIRIHHIASQKAITAALQSILQAFSPESLLARFRQYRRTEQDNNSDDNWAWYMYQQYFHELTSARQQGFQRLFRQVYHQVYDRVVREQQEQK